MNRQTWKLPLPLLTILAGMFAFAFFFLPGSVAEAACGAADPTTATFYYPMEAAGESNNGTGGTLDPTYDNGPYTTDTTIANNGEAGNVNRLLIDGSSDQQIRFVDTSTALNGPFGDVTYEFWFDVDAVTGRQQLFEVGGATRGIGIYLDGNTIHAGMWEDTGGGLVAGQNTAFTSITGIQANTAYHVIVVKTGASIDLYVDSNGGALGPAATATRSDADATIGAAGSQATIGDSFGGSTIDHTLATITDGTSQMTGSVDEFAVYDGTALTSAQVNDPGGAFDSCEPTAVSMSDIGTSAASSLPYIAIAVLVLGTATVVILRRERVLN